MCHNFIKENKIAMHMYMQICLYVRFFPIKGEAAL